MGQIEYFLEFPYGTQGNAPLTHEFKLEAISTHYDHTGKSYQKIMGRGYSILFEEIRSYNQVCFFKFFNPLDYLSVFSSAIADKRIIPYSKLFAKEGKALKSVLDILDYRVIEYKSLSLPDAVEKSERTILAVYVVLAANRIL